MRSTAIAIVADYDSNNRTHAATSEAIEHCSATLGFSIEHRWIGTEELAAADGTRQLAGYDGIWIGPGSPSKSMEAALRTIRLAREQGIPLLGTCGGFQHIILEYARNVLGYADAEHAETQPEASRLFISRLACSLVGRTMSITLQPKSVVARLYGRTTVQEQYQCNFGVNPDYVETLRSSALKIVGSDEEGVVRLVELPEHPFFIGSLFLPQMTSTRSTPHPLVLGLIEASVRARKA